VSGVGGVGDVVSIVGPMNTESKATICGVSQGGGRAIRLVSLPSSPAKRSLGALLDDPPTVADQGIRAKNGIDGVAFTQRRLAGGGVWKKGGEEV